MAKKHDDNITGSDVPHETGIHSKIHGIGNSLRDRADYIVIPGDGIYLSKAAVRNSSVPRNDYYDLRMSENTVLELASKIKASRKIKDRRQEDAKEYNEKCYDETDALDPEKDGSSINRRRNQYTVDHSRSTISIHDVSSTGTYLNGSSTKHYNYIEINIMSPDDRHVVTASMSYEQFASVLVSNMHIPCTLSRYWDINDDNVLMSEVVKPPESVRDRMIGRINDDFKDSDESISKMINVINEQIESGKPMNKTKMRELAHDLTIEKSRIQSSVGFTATQAAEEVSRIVEKSAITLATQYRIDKDKIKLSLPNPKDMGDD